jgi:tripartite-type tricarboxylate transporter receptor subunit TctC
MKLPRREFLHLGAGAAALPAVSRIAWAQTYPTRPVRIIVGFPPGGGADITARLIGQWLSERLGQQFIIDNRPGAATNIATEAIVRAAADGYTLLLVHSSNAMNATLYEKLNFNFIRDIAPAASIIVVPNVMVVHPSVPAKTVPEFIAYAKANPGKINMATVGAGGTTPYLAGELFKGMTGVEWVWVQYRGEYMPDLISGQVQATFSVIPRSIDYIRTGQLRALAVTSATRLEVLPGRWQRLVGRRTLEASKLRERTIKLRNLAAPRRRDALDISRRACAKLFGKIIQHAFERAFELAFEILPLCGDGFANEPIHFGTRQGFIHDCHRASLMNCLNKSFSSNGGPFAPFDMSGVAV